MKLILLKKFKKSEFFLKNQNKSINIIKKIFSFDFLTTQPNFYFCYGKSFNFIFFFYFFKFFLTIFYKEKTLKYNYMYFNVLSKQNNSINSFLYHYYMSHKTYFFKKFNKNFLKIYKKGKYKGIKIIKFQKNKDKDKITKDFLNLNSYFFNSEIYNVKKFNLNLVQKISLNIKKKEIFFFNSNTKKLIKTDKSYKINLENLYKNTNYNSFFKNYWIVKKKKIISFRKKKKKPRLENNIKILYKKFGKKKTKFFKKLKNNVYNYKSIYFIKRFFFNFKKLTNYFFKINKIKLNNFNFFYKKKEEIQKKTFFLNYKNAYKNVLFLNDFYHKPIILKNNETVLKMIYKNNFFLKNLKLLSNLKSPSIFTDTNKNFLFYNNYYPIFFCGNRSKNLFFTKFKLNFNINYLSYMQFYILGFLENFFKKKILIRMTNNFFKKPGNRFYLDSIFYENKNFQPRYMKKFFIRDFIEILWYSFYLKDLTLLSDWLCKFLEFTHFRFHRKFILFFQNFIHKYTGVFMDVLNIRGFFFDIRGKVGVAGNSKKRHFFFKMGQLNRSTKSKKINLSQSVVRTPSGALGLILMINY